MSNLKLANLIEDFKIEVIAPSGDSNISELKINIDFVDIYKGGVGLDNIQIFFTDDYGEYSGSLILNEDNLIEGNIFDGKLEGIYKYKLNPGTYEIEINVKNNSVTQNEGDSIELDNNIFQQEFIIPIFAAYEENPPLVNNYQISSDYIYFFDKDNGKPVLWLKLSAISFFVMFFLVTF